MDPKLLKLAFTAVKYGADKIPDRVFEAIPGGYYKSKDVKETAKEVAGLSTHSEPRSRRDRRRHQPRRRRSFSDSDSEERGSDELSDLEKQVDRRERNRGDRGSGYPGPRDAYPPSDPYGRRESKPAGAGPNIDYYAGYSPHEDRRYPRDRQQAPYYGGSNQPNANNAPSSDNRYRGAGNVYYPNDRRRMSSRPRFVGNDRDSDNDIASSSQSDSAGSRYGRRRQRSRSSSRKRRSSRSRIREALREPFDQNPATLFPGAIGALAGGLLGKEVGNGKLATIAGAVIGGVGGSAWGKRRQKRHGDDYDTGISRANSVRSRSRSRPRRRRDNGYDSY